MLTVDFHDETWILRPRTCGILAVELALRKAFGAEVGLEVFEGFSNLQACGNSLTHCEYISHFAVTVDACVYLAVHVAPVGDVEVIRELVVIKNVAFFDISIHSDVDFKSSNVLPENAVPPCLKPCGASPEGFAGADSQHQQSGQQQHEVYCEASAVRVGLLGCGENHSSEVLWV